MYKRFIRPILDRLDSERWHSVAKELFHVAESSEITLRILEFIACGGRRFVDDRLNTDVSGVGLDNPLLVGAGWDKEGRAVRALWTIGFAGVEVGSVLEHPQPGNPKPRQFMVDSGVCLNWLGFNSPGMEVVARNLSRYKGLGIPIGISIGINRYVSPHDAPRAHAVVARRLYEYASYFAINVSSPNTPDLRKLQDKDQLSQIVKAVKEVVFEHKERKPIFVKIAPELSNSAIDDVIEVVLDNEIGGIIATNSTNNPDIKAKYGEKWRNVPGGISGDDEDFRRVSTEKVAYIYSKVGDKLDIIGVGGIKDTQTALDKIMAGAKALQIVTGLRGEGISLPTKINKGLVAFMKSQGIKNIKELVGVGFDSKIKM